MTRKLDRPLLLYAWASIILLAFSIPATAQEEVVCLEDVTHIYYLNSYALVEISLEDYLEFLSRNAPDEGAMPIQGNLTPPLRALTEDWSRYDITNYGCQLMLSQRERIPITTFNSTDYPSYRFLNYRAFPQVPITHQILPGYYGWMEFIPLQNYSSGYLSTFSWLGDLKSQEFITVDIPMHQPTHGFLFEYNSLHPPL